MLITITNFVGSPNIIRYVNSTLQGKYKCRIVNCQYSNGQFGVNNRGFMCLYSQDLYNPVGNSPLLFTQARNGNQTFSENYNSDDFYFIVNLSGTITFEILLNSINRTTGLNSMALFTLAIDLEKIY
jgi:hypothetical protein